ncbi:MAG: trypsin-like peptidase domain-containing protein [bacterium]
MNSIRRALAIVASLAALAHHFGTPARAQTAEVPFRIEAYALSSGAHDGAATDVLRAFQHTLRIDDARWMQVIFASHELGRGSWVSIRSLRDGDVQTLDARSMKTWRSHSGYFNGNALEIALHVAPEDRGAFIEIDRVVVGERARAPIVIDESAGVSKDICGGADNRVASNDNRIGRVMPIACTAWRVTSGAFLTAGHCVDLDPDGGGSMLPDGILDTLTVVQFNVPLSDTSGTITNPPIADQFPVNNSTVAWRFDGSGQGFGKDWAVFTTGANSQSGLLAHEQYGFPFRMTRETPAAGATMRVTGFGVDSLPAGNPPPFNQQSQTNQTMTGNYVGEMTSGADIWVQHAVDTEGGNSGSPILWEANGLAIGVHTNGGCFGGGSNGGTSFEVDALETALRNLTGTSVRFVDVGHPLPVVEDGTIFRPYNTLVEGTDTVPTGGIVSVVTGTYPVGAGRVFNRAMMVVAPTGTVLIRD